MESESVLLADYTSMFEKCVLVKVETGHAGVDAGDVADISSFARYLRRSLSLPKLADKVLSMSKDESNGYITWAQALTLVEPYLKTSKADGVRTDTSFINDENRPNQQTFQIKVQSKSLSNTPIASSKGLHDRPLERRPSFHFEDTISCIRSQDLDCNSLVSALHNHLSTIGASEHDDFEWQQRSLAKSIAVSGDGNGVDEDVPKLDIVDLNDANADADADTPLRSSTSVLPPIDASSTTEQLKPRSQSASPVIARRKSGFLQSVTSAILGSFSRSASPAASPSGTPRQSARSPSTDGKEKPIQTSSVSTTEDGWKVISDTQKQSESSGDFNESTIFPKSDTEFQGLEHQTGKPPKHGRNSRTSLSINTFLSVSRRQSIDSGLGSNEGSEVDSPSSAGSKSVASGGSTSGVYNYKAPRRSSFEALGLVSRPSFPSPNNKKAFRRFSGTGSVTSSVAGDSPKAGKIRSGVGLASRLRAEVLHTVTHTTSSSESVLSALNSSESLEHTVGNLHDTLSCSGMGAGQEEAATNRLKEGLRRMQERVNEPEFTQFNPYGLLSDGDVVFSGDAPGVGSWEYYSSRAHPLCMSQQAVETRRKELLLSLPTLLVRNRNISFPHSVEVQADSPLWEHYRMIARPEAQTVDGSSDETNSFLSSSYAHMPHGGLQRPSHVGVDDLSEHDLHSGIAFCGAAARRTRHGFFAQRFLVLYGERNEMNGLPCFCVYAKSAPSAWGETPVGFKSCVLASDILDVAIEEPKNTSRHLWQITATRFFTHKQEDVDHYSDGQTVKIVFDAPTAVDRLSWISWLLSAKTHSLNVVARQSTNAGNRS